MKTSQIFLISAIIITGAFFGILSLVGMPNSLTEWIISDAILGIILFISYLVIALRERSSKNKSRLPLDNITV